MIPSSQGPVSAHFTTMRAIYPPCLWVLLFHLVSSCDEETHYMKDGKCCKLCGPGKRMLVDDNCEDPRCQDCPDGEYQSRYTKDIKCSLQPSCDTNLNFMPQTSPSKTSLSTCECKPGFHCTEGDDCSMCLKHTVCRPGERIIRAGSSVTDTVCEACKNETFSSHYSSSTCRPWTTCDPGYKEKTPGSLTSDRICEKGSPTDRAAILTGIMCVLLIIVAAVGVMIFIKKRKIGKLEWKKISKDLTIRGTKINLHPENEVIAGGDQGANQQPEEDVDHSCPVSPSPSNVTENGNFVAQEDGKPSLCPSSETSPFIESSIL